MKAGIKLSRKFLAILIALIVSVLLICGIAFAASNVFNNNEEDFSVDLTKTTSWEEEYNKGKIELTAEAKGKGVGKKPRVLFLGTLCGAHKLTKEKIVKAVDAVASVADVDYCLLNGQDKTTYEDLFGTLEMGQTLEKDQKPDYDKIPNTLNSGNHKSLNKFLDQIYTHVNALKANGMSYDGIVLEFDRTILAHSYGRKYKEIDMPKSQYEKQVATIMNDFYDKNAVVWILKPSETQEYHVEPNEHTPYGVTPAFFRYNDTTSEHNWQELDNNDKKTEKHYDWRQYNAYKALVCPSRFNYTDNYKEDTRPDNPLYYDEKDSAIENQINYNADAATIASFVTKSVESIFYYSLVFNDTIQVPQGCVYNPKGTYFEISEDGKNWEKVTSHSKYDWTITEKDGKVTGTFNNLIYKKYVKLVVSFFAENEKVKFIEESKTGNPNDGSATVDMKGADKTSAKDEDNIDPGHELQWPVDITYKVESGEAANYCDVSLKKEVGSDGKVLMTNDDYSYVKGSTAQPGSGWKFEYWSDDKTGELVSDSLYWRAPYDNVNHRNVSNSYTAHFSFKGSIQKSANVSSPNTIHGGDVLVYTIKVNNNSGVTAENVDVVDDLSVYASIIDYGTAVYGKFENNVATWTVDVPDGGIDLILKIKLNADITKQQCVDLGNAIQNVSKAKFKNKEVTHDPVITNLEPRQVQLDYSYVDVATTGKPEKAVAPTDVNYYDYAQTALSASQEQFGGWTFSGWFIDKSCSKKFVDNATPLTPEENEKYHLYGKWNFNTELDKSVNVPEVTAGNNFIYTVTVTNNSDNNISGITVKDLLNKDVVFVSSDKGVYKDGVVTWSNVNVAANDSVSLTFVATTDPFKVTKRIENLPNTAYTAIEGKELSDTAYINVNPKMIEVSYSYVGEIIPPSINPPGPFNIVYGTEYEAEAKQTAPGYEFDGWYADPSCEVPYVKKQLTDNTVLYGKWSLALDFEKTVSPKDEVKAGDTVTYYLTITNKSFFEVSGIKVVDTPLDANIEKVSEISDGGVQSEDKTSITWLDVTVEKAKDESTPSTKVLSFKAKLKNIIDPMTYVNNPAQLTYNDQTIDDSVTIPVSQLLGKVTYHYVEGLIPEPVIKPEDSTPIAYGQTQTVAEQTPVGGWIFDGWYYDKECHSKVPSTIVIDKPETPVYGKWDIKTYMNKTANPDTVTAGDEFSYTITVKNESLTDITGIKVVDKLDDRINWVNKGTDEKYDVKTREVYWENVDILAQSSIELSFVAKSILDFQDLPGTIVPNNASTLIAGNELNAQKDIIVKPKMVEVQYAYKKDSVVPTGLQPPKGVNLAYNTEYDAVGPQEAGGYVFHGWFSDPDCTTSYVKHKLVEDLTIIYGYWEFDMPVVKSVSPSTDVKAGDTIKYTLAVTNKSAVDVDGAKVVDGPLDQNIESVDNINYGGKCENRVTTWDNLKVAAGSTINLCFDAKIKQVVGYGTIIKNNGVLAFDNQKSVSNEVQTPVAQQKCDVYYHHINPPKSAILPGPELSIPYGTEHFAIEQIDVPGYIFSGWCTDETCDTPYEGSIISKPRLDLYGNFDCGITFTKEASSEKVDAGQDVTYTITINNNTDKAISGLTVTDTLDKKLIYNGSNPTASYSSDTGICKWYNVSVPAKSFTPLYIYVKPDLGIQKQTSIPNIASTIVGGEEFNDEADILVDPCMLHVQYQFVRDILPEGATPPSSDDIIYGTKYSSKPQVPFEGYVFHGWYTNKDCTDVYVDQTPIYKDTTLYGYWTEDTVTINYKVADTDTQLGGVSSNGETIRVYSDDASGSLASPSEGCSFVEWTKLNGEHVSDNSMFKPDKVDGKNVAETYVAHFKFDSTIEKSVEESDISAGGTLHYEIYVTNSSTRDISNWVVTDNTIQQESGASFVNIIPHDGGIWENNVITWRGDAEHVIAAGETKTLSFDAETFDGSTSELNYKNKAYLKVGNIDQVVSNEVSTPVHPKTKDLIINKNWSDADSVHKDEELNVVIYQNGAYYCGFVLNEKSVWSDIKWCTKVSGLPVYNPLTGEKYKYTIAELQQDGTKEPVAQGGTYNHKVAEDKCIQYRADYTYTDYAATITNTYIVKDNDLSINKIGSKTIAKPNDDITYTLTVEYGSEYGMATNISVEDKLPEGLAFVSASDDGQYDPESNKVQWVIPRVDINHSCKLTLVCKVPQDTKTTIFKNVAQINAYGNPPSEKWVTKTDLTPEPLQTIGVNIRKSILRYDEAGEEVDYLFTNETIGGDAVLRYYLYKYKADELQNPAVTDLLPVGLIPPESHSTKEYDLISEYIPSLNRYKVTLKLNNNLTEDVTPINLPVTIDPNITERLDMISNADLKAEYINSEGEPPVVLSATSNETEMLVDIPKPIDDPIPSPPVVTDVKEITVVKIWSDGAAEHSSGNVEVSLFQNDVLFDTQLLNSDNGWKYTWVDLQITTEKGVPIVYSLKENTQLDDYTTTVKEDEDGNYIVTNTKVDVPPVVPVPIEDISSVNMIQTSDDSLVFMITCLSLTALCICGMAIRVHRRRNYSRI